LLCLLVFCKIKSYLLGLCLAPPLVAITFGGSFLLSKGISKKQGSMCHMVYIILEFYQYCFSKTKERGKLRV
jgi:hypothetical protein